MVSFADGQALERALNPPTTFDKDTKVDVEEPLASDTPIELEHDESPELSKGEETTTSVDTKHSLHEASELSAEAGDVSSPADETVLIEEPKVSEAQVEPLFTPAEPPTTTDDASTVVEIPSLVELSLSTDIDVQALSHSTESNKEEFEAAPAEESSSIPEVISDSHQPSEDFPAPVVKDEQESIPEHIEVEQTPSGSAQLDAPAPEHVELLGGTTAYEELSPEAIQTVTVEDHSDVIGPAEAQLDPKQAPAVAVPALEEPQLADEEPGSLPLHITEAPVAESSTESVSLTTTEEASDAPQIPVSFSTESTATLIEPMKDEATESKGEIIQEHESIDANAPVTLNESVTVTAEPAPAPELSSIDKAEATTPHQPEETPIIVSGTPPVEEAAELAPVDSSVEAEELPSATPAADEQESHVAIHVPTIEAAEPSSGADNLKDSEPANPEPTQLELIASESITTHTTDEQSATAQEDDAEESLKLSTTEAKEEPAEAESKDALTKEELKVAPAEEEPQAESVAVAATPVKPAEDLPREEIVSSVDEDFAQPEVETPQQTLPEDELAPESQAEIHEVIEEPTQPTAPDDVDATEQSNNVEDVPAADVEGLIASETLQTAESTISSAPTEEHEPAVQSVDDTPEPIATETAVEVVEPSDAAHEAIVPEYLAEPSIKADLEEQPAPESDPIPTSELAVEPTVEQTILLAAASEESKVEENASVDIAPQEDDTSVAQAAPAVEDAATQRAPTPAHDEEPLPSETQYLSTEPERPATPALDVQEPEALGEVLHTETPEAPANTTADEATPAEIVQTEPIAEQTEVVEPSLVNEAEIAESDLPDATQGAPTIPVLEIPEHSDEAVKPDDIERPKSPWTPSYSVLTQGPDVAEESEAEKLEAPAYSQPDVPELKIDTAPVAEGAASQEEIPRSPNWTPSYSVSQQGSPLIPTADLPSHDETVTEPASEVLEPPASITSGDNKAETSTAVEEAEEQVIEPQSAAEIPTKLEAQSEVTTPILQLPEDELVVEPAVTPAEESQPVGWTPSYSVSRQGSPSITSKELSWEHESSSNAEETAAAVDASTAPAEEESSKNEPVEETATAPIWTPSYSVSRQGSPLASPKPLEPEIAESPIVPSVLEPETEANVASAAEAEPESSTSAVPTDSERPVSPWTPSYSVTTQAPDQEPAVVPEDNTPVNDMPTVPEVPMLQLPADDVEVSQTTDVPPERPSSPWTPSYSVTTQAPAETADTTDIPVLAPVPVPANAAAHAEVDQQSNAVTAEALQSPSPSWTPSYSVSNLGSPIAEKQPELTDAQHERSFSDEAKVNLVVDEAPSVSRVEANNDFKTNGHPLVALANGTEAVDQKSMVSEQSFVPLESLQDVKLPTIDTVHLNSSTEEPPRPASPWTPSYSVSKQGSPLPQTTELEPSVSTESETKVESVEELEPQSAEDSPKIVIEEDPTPAPAPTETIEVPKSPIWTPSYSVSHQGASNSHDEGLDKLEQLPSLAGSGENFPAVDKNRPSLQVDTDDQYSRTRLESTTSSRFFPGGWFSSTPKSPEGRTSLDNAQGEITPAKANVEEPGKRKSRLCLIM